MHTLTTLTKAVTFAAVRAERRSPPSSPSRCSGDPGRGGQRVLIPSRACTNAGVFSGGSLARWISGRAAEDAHASIRGVSSNG